jgi:hypothetical protein
MKSSYNRSKFLKLSGFAAHSVGRGLELIENTSDSEVLIIDKNNRKLYSKGFVENRN